MPLYEYECQSCGYRFEVIQRFSDDPVKECRECKQPVRRLISAPAIQFKGTGWYVTDYANKSGSSPSKKEEPSSSPSSSNTATTSTNKSSKTTSTKKD